MHAHILRLRSCALQLLVLIFVYQPLNLSELPVVYVAVYFAALLISNYRQNDACCINIIYNC